MLAPGPRGVPWFGQMHHFAADSCQYLIDLHARYGAFVHLRAAGTPVFCVYEPDAIEHVLVRNQKNYMKDRYLKKAHDLFGRGLITNEGDDWLKQRRIMQPAFHKQRIDAYGEHMRLAIEARMSALRAGGQVDFQAEMSVLTLDILNRCLFGREGTREAEEIAGPVALLSERFAELGFVLEPRWWPSKGRRQWERAIASLEVTLDKIVEERRASPGQDLLSFMIEAFGTEPQRVRDEALTLLLAGHETTALSLTFAWYLLAHNPHYARQLAEQCRAAFGGQVPTVAQLGEVPLLEQINKETLRLYPPVYLMAREALHPDVIGGFDVEPGTQVLFAQWVLHRDPRWFSDPLHFVPERWTESFEKQLPKYAYFPFGGGPRLCIGLAFAQLEAKMALATLIQHFVPRLASQQPLQLLQSITLRPKDGLPVLLAA